MSACAVCGLPLSNIVDERGERWIHTVEPLDHPATPSDSAMVGRARAMADVGQQLELSLSKGKSIDADWVRNWVEWYGKPSVLVPIKGPEVVPDPA